MLGTGNEFVFNAENTKLELANYEVESATIKVGNYGQQQNLYSIKATYDWDRSYYTYTYKTSANGSEQTISSSQNVTISVYYKRVSEEATGNLSIDGSNIADTGAITAAYNGTLPQGAYYKWYRQLADGTWQQVSGQVGDSLEIYRDGARVTYKVELWQLNGTQAVDESAPFQVPYYDQLQNGSFEDTPVSGSNLQFTNGLYPEMVWQTTGLGELNTDKHADGQDIEIVNASALQNNSNNPYGVTQARAGNQLAELNCEYEGALYQDVLTAPGVDLTWWASHRARNLNYNNHDAEDTMYVVIMDAEVAAQYVTTQTEIDNIVEVAQRQGLQEGKDGTTREATTVNRTYGGETVPVTVWKITSGINETAEWVEGDWWNPWDEGHYEYTEIKGGFYDYSDTYLVPEGQYLTRFFFAAGNTSTNNRTVGNLLDRVGFSQYPPTPENQGAIAITKTVTGLDEDITIPAGSFTFTVNGQVVRLPTSDAKPTQTSAWTATVNLTPGTYTVTEGDPSSTVLSEGYQYSSTSSNYNGNVVNGLTSSEILVQNGNTSAVVFTNTYTPTTTDVTVTKTITGLEEDEEKLEELVNGLTFTLTDTTDSTKTYTTTAGALTAVPGEDGKYTVTIDKVEPGTYKVAESDATVEGYTVEKTIPQNATVTLDGENVINVTNDYTPDNNDLKITKEAFVSGVTPVAAAASYIEGKEFTFIVKAGEGVKDKISADDTFTVEGGKPAQVSFTADDNGVWSTRVTLTGASSLTIYGLPVGTYTVEEIEESKRDLNDVYYVSVAYKSDDNGGDDDGKVADPGNDYETNNVATLTPTTAGWVKATNNYEFYKTLTITKSVTGEMGTADDWFTFTVTSETNPNMDVTITSSDPEVARKIEDATETNLGSFQLKNGKSVTIGHLKHYAEITVTEGDNSLGYQCTGIDFAPNLSGVTSTKDQYSITIKTPSATDANIGTVTFINKRQAVAPTGLESDHNAPFALMVGAAFLAGAALLGNVVLRRRRRWQE